MILTNKKKNEEERQRGKTKQKKTSHGNHSEVRENDDNFVMYAIQSTYTKNIPKVHTTQQTIFAISSITLMRNSDCFSREETKKKRTKNKKNRNNWQSRGNFLMLKKQ